MYRLAWLEAEARYAPGEQEVCNVCRASCSSSSAEPVLKLENRVSCCVCLRCTFHVQTVFESPQQHNSSYFYKTEQNKENEDNTFATHCCCAATAASRSAHLPQPSKNGNMATHATNCCYCRPRWAWVMIASCFLAHASCGQAFLGTPLRAGLLTHCHARLGHLGAAASHPKMSLKTPPQQTQKPETGTEAGPPPSGPPADEGAGVPKKRVLGVKESDERDLMWKVNVSNSRLWMLWIDTDSIAMFPLKACAFRCSRRSLRCCMQPLLRGAFACHGCCEAHIS